MLRAELDRRRGLASNRTLSWRSGTLLDQRRRAVGRLAIDHDYLELPWIIPLRHELRNVRSMNLASLYTGTTTLIDKV